MSKILEVIDSIRNSFYGSETVYLNENSFGLYKIIKNLFKESTPYMSEEYGVIIRYKNKFYNILGEIFCEECTEIKEKEFKALSKEYMLKRDSIFESNSFIYKEYKEALDKTAIVSKGNLDGTITYVNQNFCDISGYSKEELIGHPHSIVRHPDMNATIFKEMWEKIKSGKVWKGEIKNKKKDGSSYTVNATIIPQIIREEIIGFIGIRYNITEIKEQRILTQRILDSQKEIFILGHIKHGLKLANNSFFKELGFISLAHFKSKHKSIIELFQNLDTLDPARMKRLKNIENVEINNIEIKTNAGKTKFYNLFLNVIDNEYIMTLSDITKMNKLIQKAQNESYMKSNFLATMSHEIRTPLNGITPYIDYLLETNIDEEQREYLLTIKNSSMSLLRVINDILDFSKIESGKLEIEEIEFDPIIEIESVINLYAAKTQEKNIQFCAFVDPTLPTYLKGDILRIKQIINNLLSNAIKFTPVGGDIDFNFEFLNIVNDKAIIEVYVKDNGIGISKENQKLMFKPFSQESSSITRTFGGTGLGLSISQQLAKLMKSKIILESKLDKGSKFSFTLELPIINTCKVKNFETNKNISIYIANNKYMKCLSVLKKYLRSFGFQYKEIKDEIDFKNSNDLLFVISSGDDSISWLNENYKDRKIVSVIPSKELNSNVFTYSDLIIMPLNGSKIYDSIVDTKLNHLRQDRKGTIPKKMYYNAKVLVAEDNPTNRKIVEVMLKKHKINVAFAENGIEAIEYYEDNFNSIDLILMDIHMPKLDGKKATLMIREYEIKKGIPSIPIVALTADAIKEHQHEFIDIGMNKVLSKPIESDKFQLILEEFLSSKEKKDFSKTNQLLEEINEQKTNITSTIAAALEIDEDTAKMLYDSFIIDWENLKGKISKEYNKKNFKQLQSYFHQLKGASGSLKLIEIHSLTKELESFCKEEKLFDESLLKDLEHLINNK